MKRIIVLFVAFLVALFASAGVVFAQSSNSQKIVDVKAEDVINHDFFASGDLVTISGKVNGDAYVFAQKVVVNGEVNGDLIAAGGEILIPGKVDHDARLAASKISISGTVDGSVTAGSGEFIYERSGRIGNSAVIATNDVSLQGYIGKDLTIWASKVIVNNNVGGSILAAVSDLKLDPGARIGGDITYWASSNMTVNMGSDIRGQTVKHEIKNADSAGSNIEKSIAGAKFALKVFGFLFSLILGLAIIRLLPVYSSQVVDFIAKKTFRSFWVGLLILLATPLLILILFLTIVGIPFAFILLFVLILIFCLSKIFIALALGNWLETKFKLSSSASLTFVGGLIVYTLISMIPVVGGVFSIIGLLAGSGALACNQFAFYRNLRAKKLI